MTQHITIVGGTGHLSTRVVRRLVESGVHIKLIARDPAKAQRLFGDRVEVVFGDVSDPGSLEHALQGTRNLYIHLNTEVVDPSISFYTEREGVKNLVRAAEAAGVEHILQIAGIEASHPEFFTAGIVQTHDIRLEGMRAIEASAIPHTFLVCSMFSDSLPKLVSDGVCVAFGPQDGSIHFTNTDQLADTLRRAAGNPDAFGASIPVQGEQGLTFARGAAEFFAGYDPSVQVVPMPIEAISAFGLPEAEASFLMHIAEVTAGMKEQRVQSPLAWSTHSEQSSIRTFGEQLRREQESSP